MRNDPPLNCETIYGMIWSLAWRLGREGVRHATLELHVSNHDNTVEF